MENRLDQQQLKTYRWAMGLEDNCWPMYDYPSMVMDNITYMILRSQIKKELLKGRRETYIKQVRRFYGDDISKQA